ncbi:prepilin peptidase-dependent protein [Pectobacteriaceae bacterium CE90]|nr:prepilin peptidase-dependent protein [Pectobacteriaceae bacterium CE90]
MLNNHNHNQCGQSGFTLLEMMVALGLSSLIILSTAQIYPVLRAQSQNSAHYFRLEQLLSQTLYSIEKDIRRAGFCAGTCSGSALTLIPDTVNPAQNCLTVAYDVNRNGKWDETDQPEAEFFSYRLRSGALEIQTGRRLCQGERWEKLLDPDEVTITQFQVLPQSGGDHTRYAIQLAGYWSRRPEIKQQVGRLVVRLNDEKG